MINENVESGYDSGRTLYDKDIRDPLFDFLEETYGKTRILEEKRTGNAEKSKLFVQDKLIEKVPGDTLWPQAYDELFERDYNTISQEIEEFRRRKRRIADGTL